VAYLRLWEDIRPDAAGSGLVSEMYDCQPL